MNGAGNDFVVIDNRSLRISSRAAMARKLCDRHTGVGADGLLLLEPSARASYRMMYYNADGSYGGMCGNGGRCIAAFAVTLGASRRSHKFEALGHVYAAEVGKKGLVKLRMKDPQGMRIGLSLPYGKDTLSVHAVDTGSPHAVVFLRRGKLALVDVTGIGRWLREHSTFLPQGVNANFVEKIGVKSLRMRTYERGVEAETMACGTGSVASSVLAAVTLGLRSPVAVHTRSGDILRVHFKRDGAKFFDVVLLGPVAVSFTGEILV